jgi:hypothetical protein
VAEPQVIRCPTCGTLFAPDEEYGLAHAQTGRGLTRSAPDVVEAFELLRAAAGDRLDGLDVEAHRERVWGCRARSNTV